RPRARGVAAGFDIGVAQRDHDFALKFEAVLPIDREALYTFRLTSDDGSRLEIDGKLGVDNDGIHAPQTRAGRARLTKGIHKVHVGFMQGGGGAELSASISAPGLGEVNLGDLVATSEEALRKPRKKTPDEDAIDIQPALVAKGAALFASLGCASC